MKKIIFAVVGVVVGLLIGYFLDNLMIGYIIAAVLGILGFVFGGSPEDSVEVTDTQKTRSEVNPELRREVKDETPEVVVNPIPTGERVAHDPLSASAVVNDPLVEEPVVEESTPEDLKPLNLEKTVGINDEKIDLENTVVETEERNLLEDFDENAEKETFIDPIEDPVPPVGEPIHDPVPPVGEPIHDPVIKDDRVPPMDADGPDLKFNVNKPGEDFRFKSKKRDERVVERNPEDVEYNLDDFPKLGPDNELLLDDQEELERDAKKFKADKYVEGEEPIERKDVIEGRGELIDRTIIDGEIDRR